MVQADAQAQALAHSLPGGTWGQSKNQDSGTPALPAVNLGLGQGQVHHNDTNFHDNAHS